MTPPPTGCSVCCTSTGGKRTQVRDGLRDYVVEHLGDADAVLAVDDTAFLKKGGKLKRAGWDSNFLGSIPSQFNNIQMR